MIQSYKDLIVWQKGFQSVLAVYRLTGKFPKSELFGLTSQMRRSAVSIVSNIAEGYARRTDGEFMHFLLISLGSTAELETQLLVAKNLNLTNDQDFFETSGLLTEVSKLLSCFVRKIKERRK